MSFDPERWLRSFVLPLVAGGDVHVSGAIGARERAEWAQQGLAGDASALTIAKARHAIIAELLLQASEPLLDEESLRLAAAVQNLLFLLHPENATLGLGRRKLRAVSAFGARLAALPLPDPKQIGERAAVRILCERHSMLHHLFDLGRDDVRVRFWAGKREFRGAEPPPRLMKWPELRRVREERWRVTVIGEAMADPNAQPIVAALLAASPLTDLFEPSRLDPALSLFSLCRWLRLPLVARMVVDRWLRVGLAQVGGAYAAALIRLYNEKGSESRSAAQTATAFLSHLHLVSLLGRRQALSEREQLVELQGTVQGHAALRDFFGLFAAAQRVGLGRPADLARDRRLSARADAYATACAQLVGHERLVELVGVVARGIGVLQLEAAPASG